MRRCLLVVPLLLAGCSSDLGTAKDCTTNNGGCDPNAKCTIVSDVPTCECSPGFSGDGLKCEDVTDPVLAILAPAADTVFKKSSPSTVEVSGTVVDVSPVEVTVSLDGAIPQPAQVATGTFRFTLSLADEDFTKHTVVVEAKDAAKNGATATRTFIVDRVGPVLVIATPSTDAVCAESCTGAVVNIASGAEYEFAGTVEDRGGADLDSLAATMDDGPVEVTKGAAWSFKWSAIPQANNGVAHTFRIVASDKAGNQVEAERRVYVDRVGPCAKVPVAGARLISPTAPLVEFTEAMEPRSAAGALVLDPTTTVAPVLDSGGKKLGFKNSSDLVAYQSYSLEVRATAKDKAGNPMVDSADCRANTRFLTAPAAASEVLDVSNELETLFITVDQDGKPQRLMGIWWDDEQQLNYSTELWAWDGRSGYRKTRFWTDQDPQQWEAVAAFRVRSVVGTDLQLNQVGHLIGWRFIPYTVTQTTSELFLEYSTFQNLGGASGVSKLPYGSSGTAPFAGLGVWLQESVNDEIPAAVIASLVDAKQLEKRQPGSAWGKVSDWYHSPAPIRGFGGAALANDKIVYLPNTVTLPWTLSNVSSTIPVYGVQQRQGRSAKPIGAGWVAWAEHLKSAGQDYGALYLGCSEEPLTVASWKRSLDLTPIESADRNSGITIESMQLTSNDSLVAIAVRTSDSNVYTATLPNECSLPSSLRWSAPVKGVRAVIALGPDGKVWKAGRK